MLVLAAIVSPFASSFPDGLEKVAETLGFSSLAEGPPVWWNSPLPGYTVPGVEAEDVSAGWAGILGTAAVFLLGFGVVKLLRRRGVKREN